MKGEGLLRKGTKSRAGRGPAATILDKAALSARLVADQLGHSRPSMTQDVYMGRRAVDSQAAVALEAAQGRLPGWCAMKGSGCTMGRRIDNGFVVAGSKLWPKP